MENRIITELRFKLPNNENLLTTTDIRPLSELGLVKYEELNNLFRLNVGTVIQYNKSKYKITRITSNLYDDLEEGSDSKGIYTGSGEYYPYIFSITYHIQMLN